MRLLWEHIVATLGQSVSAAGVGQSGSNSGAGLGSAQPPTMSDPAAGPAQIIGSLWRSYGPSIVASGAALLNQLPARQQAGGVGSNPSLFDIPLQSQNADFSSPLRNLHEQTSSNQSILERKRLLEAELASLAPMSDVPSPSAHVTPSGNKATTSGVRVSPTNSDTDLRVRAQYEEVEVPSDVEGYDVGTVTGSKGKGKASAESNSDEQGYSYHRGDGKAAPNMDRRASWFGWAFTSPSTGDKGGYDKLKGE